MAGLSDIKPQDCIKKAAPVPTHEFSSPWDDSDLILIVEEQKLHVHSIILKMASPVFKAMLSSDDFKEKNEKELLLPGKKAVQFVDFLRQIYIDQFPSYKIQFDNLKNISKMSEEYQIKRIAEACRNFLSGISVNKRNVAEMIVLAQEMNSEELRQKCYQIMHTMTMNELSLMKTDEQALQDVVFPKAKRLEECLRKVKPQFVGLMDCLMHVWLQEKNNYIMDGRPSTCPAHRDSGKAKAPMIERLKCEACRKGFSTMSGLAYAYTRFVRHNRGIAYSSNSKECFDDKIMDVLQEIFDLLQTS